MLCIDQLQSAGMRQCETTSAQLLLLLQVFQHRLH
jgi:hypothetical protein